MGCLRPWVSPLILALTWLFILGLLWASFYDPEPLWAPGDLSRYHSDIATCGSCHEPFRGATPQKCLDCHTINTFKFQSASDVGQLHQDVIQNERNCLTCHIEHRGVLAGITVSRPENPHGEFIFRATGASSCSDCHVMTSDAGEHNNTLLQKTQVLHLIERGDGAHRLGHFANCLTCHRGGNMDVEVEENSSVDD